MPAHFRPATTPISTRPWMKPVGLRKACERNLEQSGRTLAGRTVEVDAIPGALSAFVKIAAGMPWKEAGLQGHPLKVAKDIISYYGKAAAAMVDHVPEARAAESWIFRTTAAGKVLKEARRAMRKAKEPFWFYLIPFTQDIEAPPAS